LKGEGIKVHQNSDGLTVWKKITKSQYFTVEGAGEGVPENEAKTQVVFRARKKRDEEKEEDYCC
jgi:hypothetical protein